MSWPLALALALTGAGATASTGASSDVSTAGPVTTAAPNTGQAFASSFASACELLVSEHRSGRELARLPLARHAPEIRIAFEHSVLGTTVVDRYRFMPGPVLVEEEFEGQGYGLPSAPGPGERLERLGLSRMRLTLARPVDPLVVRAVAGPRMRLLMPQGELLLASLGAAAVSLKAVGCAGSPATLSHP